MNEHSVTVTLPNSVYERIVATARASSLTLEQVIAQSISLHLPAFEADMPSRVRSDLAKLSMLNDLQLWQTANSTMDEPEQEQLEELAALKRHRALEESEQSKLAELVEEAQYIMLCKAEARRLLAQRGHTVFSPAED